MSLSHRRGEMIKNGLLVLASLLISMAAIEAGLAFILTHPAMLASADGSVNPVLSFARMANMNERDMIQFLPACARYDSDLSYTLRPGQCRFEGKEFSALYRINRLGLRDEEEALSAPPIIVIGDSHAMGWGIAQEDTFPKRLQQSLGLTVLNAAVSSYGTAREMMMFERLDRQALKALIIQYCDNDYPENKSYVDAGGRLAIQPEIAYEAKVEQRRLAAAYYPGRYLWELVQRTGRRVSHRAAAAIHGPRPVARDIPSGATEEAQYFLDTLLLHRASLAGVKVIVLELKPFNTNDPAFITQARTLINRDKYRDLADLVSFIDLSEHLTHEDYFILDDHLNAAGHAHVAALVEAELRRRGVAP